VKSLDALHLSHLQVVRAPNDLSDTPIAALQDTIGHFRALFKGPLMANFGFDGKSAENLIRSGQADLVSFSKGFIGNPDFVRRLRDDLPLAESRPDTYYQGGSKGYIDYQPAA
jgi:N-ethylmaleimide reductase